MLSFAPVMTVQVDHEVWSRALSFFHFERLDPIKAKGYELPVPVFRPLEQALGDETEVLAATLDPPDVE